MPSDRYIRPEGAGLLVGLFEPKAAAWQPKRVPADFSFGEIAPDWDRMTPFLDTAMNRVPRVHQVMAAEGGGGGQSLDRDKAFFFFFFFFWLALKLVPWSSSQS